MNIEKELRTIKRLVLCVAFGFGVVGLAAVVFVYFTYTIQADMQSVMCVDEASYRDTVDDLIEMSKLDEAITLSTRYVEQKPKDHQGYYYLGLAYYLKGDWSNAIANLDKAAAIEPAWEARWIKPYRDSAKLNSSGQQ